MNTAESAMDILRRTGNRAFPPRVSEFTRPFWNALGDGRLVTTGCQDCGRLTFPPKPLCKSCWSRNMAWRHLRPNGRLYSFTRVHVVPRAFVADELYDIGIVDLADGVRLMCRLIGDPSTFTIDAPVDMITLLYDDGPLFAARHSTG
jgi:uncharacterized OB-fold protein